MKYTTTYKKDLYTAADLFMSNSLSMKRLSMNGFMVTNQQDKVSYHVDRHKKI